MYAGMRDEPPIQFDEDIRLMIKVRNGDRSAHDQIYSRYFSTVVSFVAHHHGHGQGCEDLAQEVFTRVWRRRAHYQPLGSVKSYLLGIAANILRESRAKGRGRVPLDIGNLEAVVDTSRASPPSQVESAEQIQTLRALMDKLSTKQKQALELVYLVGLDPDEAARQLGCSVRTLRVHLCKARQELRKLARLSQ